MVSSPRFFKEMTYLFAFIFGFALCLALCWKRLRETRRAFEAACEQNEMLWRRERRYQETFGYLRARIREIRNDLGGRALLPAPAGAAQSGSVTHVENCAYAGSSWNGGPDF